MPPRVDHQGGGTVGHIKMDIEVLALVAQHFHRVTRRKKASAVRVDRITDGLFEHRSVTGIVIYHTYQIIIHHVRCCQMHILAHRQVQRIAGLIGIHDVLVFLQHRGVTLCIVEREVDIVGEVREDIAEGVTQIFG